MSSMGLQGFEKVRGIILEAEPFSVENNLLTPTLKLKRPQLQVTSFNLLLVFWNHPDTHPIRS